MKNSVCFIGHRKTYDTPELRERLKSVLTGLIENGYENFIFGDHSSFDELCYDEITKLKETYPSIRRINFRLNYENADAYTMSFLLNGYEESIFPKGVENAGRASYIKRNQAMIDESVVCVFYYNENCVLPYRKSGTKSAFAYAIKKKKQTINLYN